MEVLKSGVGETELTTDSVYARASCLGARSSGLNWTKARDEPPPRHLLIVSRC